MALNEETTLLFENYLENELSSEDKTAFEQRLENDPELAEQFQLYRDLSHNLTHQFSEERDQFKQNLAQIGNDFFNQQGDEVKISETPKETLREEKSTKVIRFKPWQYAIAASMALLIGFFLFQNGNPNLNDYTFSEQISLTERSSENAAIKAAETNFNKGAYAEAISNFEALLAQDPSNTEIQFYKALAHDALKEYDKSEMLFATLANGTSVYKNKAFYYAGISYWKQDKISEAKELLSQILESALEYKKAQKLIRKL